jgi:hypothetical protein
MVHGCGGQKANKKISKESAMQLWNNLNTLWLLCVISMAGIIGMILVDGVWDVVLLIVTALPIILAIYRANKLKEK